MPVRTAHPSRRDSNDHFEEFILKAIQSDLENEGPGVRSAVLEGIRKFVTPSAETMPGETDFLSALRLLMAKLILQAHLHPEGLDCGLGLVLMLMRLFDYVHSGKSINSAFRLCKDPQTVRRLFGQLSEDPEIVRSNINLPRDELEAWLTGEISSVSSRTAERQYQKARSVFFETLLRVAPELSGCWQEPVFSQQVRVDPTGGLHESIGPAVNPVDFVRSSMLERCSKAEPACGVELSISGCIPRRIRIGEETVVAEFVDVAHWLFGHYGFIAGPRFSGRTTFLKAMVFQVLSTERRNLVYYLRAPEFSEAAEKKTPVYEFVAEITLSERDGGSGLHNKLADDLEALDREGRLLLLVDDLELLNEYQQRRMIVQLSPCRSVFFSITPEWKKFIKSELKRSRLEGPPLNVELLELDDAFLERLAASLYHSAGLDRPVELVPQLLASNVTDLASVPLGILALLQCQRKKHGLFAGSVALVALSEWMRRAGYDRLVLPAQAEDLQMPAAAICQLGAAIYHFWASIDFLVSDRASLRGGPNRSTFWIPWAYLQRDFCAFPISSEELLKLRLLEVAPERSAARFIYQEFEPLAGGLFAFYFPDQIRTGPFAPFRSGWAGDILQQIKEIQKLVPLLRDITLQLSKEG